MEKLAKKLENLLGNELIAVYSYEQSGGIFVPVIIVKKMNFLQFAEMKEDFENKQFIILTEDDIINGQDAFALKYLHMMKHGDLLFGEDVLLNITIDKQTLRDNLEFEIRSKLIQLREAYLSFDGDTDFLTLILPVMELIWEGILVLVDDDTVLDNDLSGLELLGSVEQLCACKIEVFQYLYTNQKVDKKDTSAVIEQVNAHLIALRDFVEGK
jgi:hypothetical protein